MIGLAIPSVRSMISTRLLPVLAKATNGVGAVLRRPGKVAGLVAAGLDNTIAVPAVFLNRLFMFWVPILPGWIVFRWLVAREYI